MSISTKSTENEYDYGIEDMDLSVKYVKSNTENVMLNDSDMINPFFVNISDVFDFNNYTINNKYSNVLIVCMKNNHNLSDEQKQLLFDKIVIRDQFLTACDELAVIEVSMNVLFNNNFKSLVKLIHSKELKLIFPKMQFENDKLVLVQFELTEDLVKMNNLLYEKEYGLNDLEKMVQLMNHYNRNFKKPIISNFIDNLMNFRDIQFWANKQNCEIINMTNVFSARKFDSKINNAEKNNSRKSTNIAKTKKLVIAKKQYYNNYPQEILSNKPNNNANTCDNDNSNDIKNHKSNISADFHDIFTAIQSAPKRTYYINNDTNISQNTINNIFSLLTDERELYNIFNTLLVSKDYCHLAFHPYILEQMKPLFSKYLVLYKYLFGYTWLCFIIEETIMKTKSTKDNRFVLTIDTVNKLPYFPYTYQDIFQNPYIILPVDEKIIDVRNNILAFPPLINGENYYGVCSLNEFKNRMNIFICGNSYTNILDGLDWNVFAVSGSIIPACLQKKSPLFDLVINDNISALSKTTDDQWKRFFNHYYENADVDLMCYSKSISDFFKKIDHVKTILQKNLNINEIKVQPHKSMVSRIAKHFFAECVDDFNEKYDKKYTLTEMENLLKYDANFLHYYIYNLYYNGKQKINRNIIVSKKAEQPYMSVLMKPSSLDELNITIVTYDKLKANFEQEENEINLYVNDFRSDNNKVSDEENLIVIQFIENMKFKISHPKLERQIECFKTHTNDFFGVVSRFHLPCVRAYYQNNNVYILPSCVTAMMTGINIDYKYFTGSYNPIDIINKYRMRGFSTLLSMNEKQYMKNYNNTVDTCGKMFYTSSSETTYGNKDLNDKIYKPQHFINNLPIDIYKNINATYIRTFEDLEKLYYNKYNYDMCKSNINMYKYTVIGENGSIQPYEKYLPEIFWNSINN
jgi:hypothetical protein